MTSPWHRLFMCNLLQHFYTAPKKMCKDECCRWVLGKKQLVAKRINWEIQCSLVSTSISYETTLVLFYISTYHSYFKIFVLKFPNKKSCKYFCFFAFRTSFTIPMPNSFYISLPYGASEVDFQTVRIQWEGGRWQWKEETASAHPQHPQLNWSWPGP